MGVSVGLIGSGGITKTHLTAYREHPEQVSLAGVCDIDEAAAASTAEEFGVETWTDYETFVVGTDVDAVDICLPHHLHYPVAKAALSAGKHVLVEKPLGISMAECVDLVACRY